MEIYVGKEKRCPHCKKKIQISVNPEIIVEKASSKVPKKKVKK